MGQKKSEIFFSNAEWSVIETTYDSHGSFEMAKGVCLRLLSDYGRAPCELRGHCKRVSVTSAEGYVLFEREAPKKA
jgi:hypothetical protein